VGVQTEPGATVHRPSEERYRAIQELTAALAVDHRGILNSIARSCWVGTPPEEAGMTHHVLVVDDEWLILDFTRSALEDLGCEVVTASNAAEALQQLLMDERIELLITDIQMPGMDGAELVERAKEMRPTLQVIVTSGRRDAPTGVPLIRKPFGIADLVEAMKRHTGLC
jgi:CheY-like chemotaxis protein